MWSAIAALSLAVFLGICTGGVWLTVNILAFLQPLLIPFAISGVLAYLLEPVVSFLCRRARMSRTGAVISIFSAIVVALALFSIAVIPALYRQTVAVVKKVPEYTAKLQKKVPEWIEASQDKLREVGEMLPGVNKTEPPPRNPLPFTSPGDTAGGASPEPTPVLPGKKNPLDSESIREYFDKQLEKLDTQIPAILGGVGTLIGRSIGGFLGVLGFALSAVIVPFCLWYFLKEGDLIKRNWGDYLPLAPSPFKDEAVSVLGEINGYLVAFFRGQLLVSLIDGSLVGIALLILGLDFAVLIGVMVVFLSLIPYLGIVICFIPAVLIAILQYGDWFHPIWVTIIFISVQQFEGFVIAPRVVGETVGLHPLTVILGALGWSLLLGGLLGALLAVPLSATLKVLLRRYVWSRRERSVLTVPLGVNDPDPDDREAHSEPLIHER